MSVTRMLARPLLSSIFFVGSWSALKNSEAAAKRGAKVTDKVVPPLREMGVPLPSDPATLVKVNAVTQLVAATALATGRAPRTSALVLAGSLVPTTLAGHAFWDETDPATRQQQKLHFAKNLSIIGGMLFAAYDKEGKPGLAWRAQHAASDVRRSARAAAKQARLEAKLAARSIT